MSQEFSYLTDDRDSPFKAEAKIFKGGNGDYYQMIESQGPRGQRQRSHAVRFATSGGASTRNPGLLRAVRDQYKAMQGQETSYDEMKAQRDNANEAIQKVLDGEISREDLEIFLISNKI